MVDLLVNDCYRLSAPVTAAPAAPPSLPEQADMTHMSHITQHDTFVLQVFDLDMMDFYVRKVGKTFLELGKKKIIHYSKFKLILKCCSKFNFILFSSSGFKLCLWLRSLKANAKLKTF